MTNTQITVAVLRGGPSEEHEVSLQSGAGVITALQSRHFKVLDVIINKETAWSLDGVVVSPAKIIKQVDVCFIALHGTYGEDGQVQSLLEELEVPFTGSDAQSSMVAIDKSKTKTSLELDPIRLAQSVTFQSDSTGLNSKALETLRSGTSWVLKPNNSGSSFGVEVVGDLTELEEVIASRLKQYESILVEEYITGREVTCGVLERFFDPITALPVVEIIPPSEAVFFDTEVKYNGATVEICPAEITDNLSNKVQIAAVQAHQQLGLAQYSRSDFIIEDVTNEIYYLETNTLPGLTAESLFPKEISAAGSSYEALVEHLVLDAIKRA